MTHFCQSQQEPFPAICVTVALLRLITNRLFLGYFWQVIPTAVLTQLSSRSGPSTYLQDLTVHLLSNAAHHLTGATVMRYSVLITPAVNGVVTD